MRSDCSFLNIQSHLTIFLCIETDHVLRLVAFFFFFWSSNCILYAYIKKYEGNLMSQEICVFVHRNGIFFFLARKTNDHTIFTLQYDVPLI